MLKIRSIFLLMPTAFAIITLTKTLNSDSKNIENLFYIYHEEIFVNNRYSSFYCVKEPLVCKTNMEYVQDPTNKELIELNEMLERWKLKINDQHKNTSNKILVLGNSGVGISTFVQFVAGNHSNMFSEEIGIGIEGYLIKEDDKIGLLQTESFTLYPEEVLISEDTSIIDLPGFSTNRNLTQDIHVTYNINNYLKNIKHNNYGSHEYKTKLVLLTEYYSVRQGVHNYNFINLIKKLYDNFYEIEDFINNIVLIVVKVPNTYKEINEIRQLIPNKNIITNIADFIKRVKLSLEDKLLNNCGEYGFVQFAIRITESLLEYDKNGNYKKINIFREPDEPGILSNIELVQENKKSLIETILNSTEKNYSQLFSPKKTMSVVFEKFQSCIKETTSKNIQHSINELRNLLPTHNVSLENEDSVRYRPYYENEKISKINEEIKTLYALKYHTKT